jgi:hypothetical protein
MAHTSTQKGHCSSRCISDKCITVNLDHDIYKKIVFGVDDKEAPATLIRELIRPPS